MAALIPDNSLPDAEVNPALPGHNTHHESSPEQSYDGQSSTEVMSASAQDSNQQISGLQQLSSFQLANGPMVSQQLPTSSQFQDSSTSVGSTADVDSRFAPPSLSSAVTEAAAASATKTDQTQDRLNAAAGLCAGGDSQQSSQHSQQPSLQQSADLKLDDSEMPSRTEGLDRAEDSVRSHTEAHQVPSRPERASCTNETESSVNPDAMEMGSVLAPACGKA